MSKAEERAREYANTFRPEKTSREDYLAGYEQAEKDLALTPDDIKLITKIHYEIVFKDTTGIKVGDVASEVLTRFKQLKEDNK